MLVKVTVHYFVKGKLVQTRIFTMKLAVQTTTASFIVERLWEENSTSSVPERWGKLDVFCNSIRLAEQETWTDEYTPIGMDAPIDLTEYLHLVVYRETIRSMLNSD